MLFSQNLAPIRIPLSNQLSKAEAPLTEAQLQKLLADILCTLPIALQQNNRIKTPLTPEFQAHSAQIATLDNGPAELNIVTTPRMLHCKA